MKIYSLNLLAYCLLNQVNFTLQESDDKQGIYFGLIEEDMDISRIKEMYQDDDELHAYLSAYKQLKMMIADKRNGN